MYISRGVLNLSLDENPTHPTRVEAGNRYMITTISGEHIKEVICLNVHLFLNHHDSQDPCKFDVCANYKLKIPQR